MTRRRLDDDDLARVSGGQPETAPTGEESGGETMTGKLPEEDPEVQQEQDPPSIPHDRMSEI